MIEAKASTPGDDSLRENVKVVFYCLPKPLCHQPPSIFFDAAIPPTADNQRSVRCATRVHVHMQCSDRYKQGGDNTSPGLTLTFGFWRQLLDAFLRCRDKVKSSREAPV